MSEMGSPPLRSLMFGSLKCIHLRTPYFTIASPCNDVLPPGHGVHLPVEGAAHHPEMGEPGDVPQPVHLSPVLNRGVGEIHLPQARVLPDTHHHHHHNHHRHHDHPDLTLAAPSSLERGHSARDKACNLQQRHCAVDKIQ